MLEQQDSVNYKFFLLEKARQETIRQKNEVRKSLLEQLANGENSIYGFMNEQLEPGVDGLSSKTELDVLDTFFIDNTLSVAVIRSMASST